MLDGQRYTFTERTDNLGRSSIMPYLPLTLIYLHLPGLKRQMHLSFSDT
jgi:hypothetical protein